MGLDPIRKSSASLVVPCMFSYADSSRVGVYHKSDKELAYRSDIGSGASLVAGKKVAKQVSDASQLATIVDNGPIIHKMAFSACSKQS